MVAATPHHVDAPLTTMSAHWLTPPRPQSPALRFHEGGSERTLTYAELATEIRAYAQGLIGLGIAPGDRVGILSTTRVEWTIADLAILAIGAITVPIYQTNSPEECQYVIEHSEMRVLLVEDAGQLDKIAEVRAQCPSIEQLVAFEGAKDGALTLDELKARGAEVDAAEVDRRANAVTPADTATLVYTSGTTGPPKGVTLTHDNFAADVEMLHLRLPNDGHERFFVFLPLAHVLTRIVQFTALSKSSLLIYWQRDPKKLLDEIAAVKPTHLPSVPRLFEKIYTAATSRSEEAGGLKAAIFSRAVSTGRRVVEAERDGRPLSPALKLQHALADKLVFSKIRALFGGEIEVCMTGAAPIEPEVMDFFLGAGVLVLEGYGMTETSGVSALNGPDAYRVGTVGRPLDGCEFKIADDGEVLMRGRNIFKGYWQNEEATAKDLHDGWLYSGDLGEIDPDGFVKITGRKKDLIITSSGKNIAPSHIESAIRQSRWVSQCVVFGDRRPYLTALITLDPDEVAALGEHIGAAGATAAELATNPAARAEIQHAIDEANRKFARIEQVKKFTILERDLTQDDGELTPTLKIKRNVVYREHAALFDAFYEGEAGE
jgi:long-chain acyl-CoA synthetase